MALHELPECDSVEADRDLIGMEKREQSGRTPVPRDHGEVVDWWFARPIRLGSGLVELPHGED